jgi:hypothetical protein
MLKLEVIEGEVTIKVEDGGVNYYKGQDPVNEVNFYKHHGGT